MSILATGTLERFFEQWKCTPEEQRLLVIQLQVIRLHEMVKNLSRRFDDLFLQDGEGI